MYNILAYVLFILICSDHFMDTSNDILQAPVLEAAVQSLQALMKDDEILSNTLCHVTCTLVTQQQWKQGEEWVWEFALAHILACVDSQHIIDTVSQAMGSLFSHGNPAVQMVLAKPLVEGIKCNQISSNVVHSIAVEICHILGRHNYLSEWCCTLSGYFELIPVILSDCDFEDFRPIVTCTKLK